SMRSGILFQPSPSHLCRNFAYIQDVANGHLLAIEHGKSGENYILGGENISYQQFSKTIQKVAPKELRIIGIKQMILEAAASINQLIITLTKTESNFVPSTVKQVFQNRKFSSNKAILQLGYSITPFEAGIKETLNQ